MRAQLIGDKDLNVFQIDVTTFKGVVQLSGFVNSAAAKSRASTVVFGIQGVKKVRNNLIVKEPEAIAGSRVCGREALHSPALLARAGALADDAQGLSLVDLKNPNPALRTHPLGAYNSL